MSTLAERRKDYLDKNFSVLPKVYRKSLEFPESTTSLRLKNEHHQFGSLESEEQRSPSSSLGKVSMRRSLVVSSLSKLQKGSLSSLENDLSNKAFNNPVLVKKMIEEDNDVRLSKQLLNRQSTKELVVPQLTLNLTKVALIHSEMRSGRKFGHTKNY